MIAIADAPAYEHGTDGGLSDEREGEVVGECRNEGVAIYLANLIESGGVESGTSQWANAE